MLLLLLLLPLLLIQTAEEETVVYFPSEPVSVPEDEKPLRGQIWSDLNSLMAAHTRVHQFSPHQPVNPPPKDDYYMMFG